jgi:single-strand DNA-binding protein
MTDLRLPEINRVLLAGRLTRDPDKRFGADGTAVTRFDLAFHRRYRTRAGAMAETTGFIAVGTFQRLAEVCGEYLRKGSPVLVEGRLQQREWQTPQGEKRSRLEIQAENVHFLERRPEPQAADAQERTPEKPATRARARNHGERT